MPIAVIDNNNENTLAWATVMWDNAFFQPDCLPLSLVLPWSLVAELLSAVFISNTGRGLTKSNQIYFASLFSEIQTWKQQSVRTISRGQNGMRFSKSGCRNATWPSGTGLLVWLSWRANIFMKHGIKSKKLTYLSIPIYTWQSMTMSVARSLDSLAANKRQLSWLPALREPLWYAFLLLILVL